MAVAESTDAAARGLRAAIEEPFPAAATPGDQSAYLVRFAMLAPSSHNTQPWTFDIDGSTIAICADREGWLVVADPDQRELYISLGCALENLVVAARHFGFEADVEILPESRRDCAAIVRLARAAQTAGDDGLFEAIAARRTSHELFDGAAIPETILARLDAVLGDLDVRLVMTQDPVIIERIDALVITADAALFSDRSYRDELSQWIGRGVFGTPWLLAKLGQLAVSIVDLGDRVGRRTGELLMSAPAFGLIASATDDHRAHLAVGRALERLYLVATGAGMGLQPISELMQAPEIRPMVAETLGLGALIPHQPFRLGYPKFVETARTPRRPFERVVRMARTVEA